jgi:hypothetical protein
LCVPTSTVGANPPLAACKARPTGNLPDRSQAQTKGLTTRMSTQHVPPPDATPTSEPRGPVVEHLAPTAHVVGFDEWKSSPRSTSAAPTGVRRCAGCTKPKRIVTSANLANQPLCSACNNRLRYQCGAAPRGVLVIPPLRNEHGNCDWCGDGPACGRDHIDVRVAHARRNDPRLSSAECRAEGQRQRKAKRERQRDGVSVPTVAPPIVYVAPAPAVRDADTQG